MSSTFTRKAHISRGNRSAVRACMGMSLKDAFFMARRWLQRGRLPRSSPWSGAPCRSPLRGVPNAQPRRVSSTSACRRGRAAPVPRYRHHNAAPCEATTVSARTHVSKGCTSRPAREHELQRKGVKSSAACFQRCDARYGFLFRCERIWRARAMVNETQAVLDLALCSERVCTSQLNSNRKRCAIARARTKRRGLQGLPCTQQILFFFSAAREAFLLFKL